MMAEASGSSRIGFQVEHTGCRLKQDLVPARQQAISKLRLVPVGNRNEILVEPSDFQCGIPFDGEIASGKPLDQTSAGGIESERIRIFDTAIMPGTLPLTQLAFPLLHHATGNTRDIPGIMCCSVLAHELRRYPNVVIEKQHEIALRCHQSVIHGFRNGRLRQSVPHDVAIRLKFLERRHGLCQMTRSLVDN